MSGVLICAAVVAWFIGSGFLLSVHRQSSQSDTWLGALLGLALIAAALYLAWRAGGAGA